MKTTNIPGCLLWGCLLLGGSAGWAQPKVSLTTMSKQDLTKAANTPITSGGIDGKLATVPYSDAQSIKAPVGKYGITYWNIPVLTTYQNYLDDKIDVLLSTLNAAYPARATVIEKLLGMVGDLTYEYHMAVGTQTGQPKSMSPAARELFMKSITESLTLDFYSDLFGPKLGGNKYGLSPDDQIRFFSSRLETAAIASGERYIVDYPPGHMQVNGQSQSRIWDKAKSMVDATNQLLSANGDLLNSGGTVLTGLQKGVDANTLFRAFSQINRGRYWQLSQPGSQHAFYLKHIAGAALASDVIKSSDGVGDRYAIDKNTLAPSDWALNQMAKGLNKDLAGLGLITVPGGTSGVIQITQPSGTSSGDQGSSDKNKSSEKTTQPVIK